MMTEQTWQPIDTAPKDGSTILAVMIYREGGQYGGIHTIRWFEGWNGWVCSSVMIAFDSKADPSDAAYPSHWMPLPEPPADIKVSDDD